MDKMLDQLFKPIKTLEKIGLPVPALIAGVPFVVAIGSISFLTRGDLYQTVYIFTQAGAFNIWVQTASQVLVFIVQYLTVMFFFESLYWVAKRASWFIASLTLAVMTALIVPVWMIAVVGVLALIGNRKTSKRARQTDHDFEKDKQAIVDEEDAEVQKKLLDELEADLTGRMNTAIARIRALSIGLMLILVLIAISSYPIIATTSYKLSDNRSFTGTVLKRDSETTLAISKKEQRLVTLQSDDIQSETYCRPELGPIASAIYTTAVGLAEMMMSDRNDLMETC